MVCKHCGNQLSIEDEVCPFCGMVNEAAQKHTQEMKHFSGQFEEVKQETLAETGKVKSYLPWLVLIGVLAAANVFVLVLLQDVYHLEEQVERWRVHRKETSYYKELTELEANGDYMSLGCLYQEKNLHYGKRLREFAAVADAGETYGRIVELVGVLAAYQKGMASEEKLEEALRYLGDSMEHLYEIESGKYYRYLEDTTDGVHRRALEEIQEETEAFLAAVCGCSEEELVELRELGSQKIIFFIREKIERK